MLFSIPHVPLGGEEAKKRTLSASEHPQLCGEGRKMQDSLVEEFGINQAAISHIFSTTATLHTKGRSETIYKAPEGKNPELQKALLEWIHGEQGKL